MYTIADFYRKNSKKALISITYLRCFCNSLKNNDIYLCSLCELLGFTLDFIAFRLVFYRCNNRVIHRFCGNFICRYQQPKRLPLADNFLLNKVDILSTNLLLARSGDGNFATGSVVSGSIRVASLRVSARLWIPAVAVTLVFLTFCKHLNLLFLLICWLMFLAAALFVCLKKARLQYFTQPLIQQVRKQIPKISDTEREAIEAGHVWWEKRLIFAAVLIGRNCSRLLFPSSTMKSSSF